jgi:hypothetical protein
MLVASLLAALLVAPRWWLLTTDPPDGVRVQVSPFGADYQGTDESDYDIVTARAFRGDLPVRDPLITDHSGDPQGAAFWEEAIGTLSRPLGSIFVGLAIAATLAALAGFLLLYALAWQATRSWAAAAALPVIAVIEQVYNQAWGFVQLYHLHILRAIVTVDPVRKFHTWVRFPAPIMLLPLFFGAALAIPRAVDSGSKRWTAAGALCVAVMVYSYLFYWTAMALALAGWLAWLLYRRDLIAARRLALLGVIAAAVASPELVSLVHNSASLSADVKVRLGVEQTAGLDTTVLARIAERLIIGLPLFWGLRSGQRRDAFYVMLFVSPLALLSIKGVLPQTWHFVIVVWDVFALPAVIAGAVGIVTWVRPRVAPRFVALAGPALVACAVAGVLHTAVLQVRAMRQVNTAFALTDDESAAFDWMDANVKDGQTVVSTSITSNYLIAILTPASVYVPGGTLTQVSDHELFDRYLRASAAFGYDEQTTFQRIDKADHTSPYEHNFEYSIGYYLTDYEILIAARRVDDQMPALHQEFQVMESSPAPLAAYPADYIYCGHRERFWPAVHTPPGTYVTVAFQHGESTVYRIAAASDVGAVPFLGCA